MSDTKKCSSWFGHKFEPRYDEIGQKFDSLFGHSGMWSTTKITTKGIEDKEPTYKHIYRGDICVRCGLIVSMSKDI